jgi:hypothetical protein
MTPRRHGEKRIPWSVLLPWLAAFAILLGAAAFALWPREAELRDPPKPGADGALVWGNGVFTNALDLEAWLRVRGVSYHDWAVKHPAAVALLAPGPKP